MNNNDYLVRLPLKLTAKGDHRHGEIELLSPRSDPSYGIVYEDKYVLLVRDRVLFPSGEEGAYLRLLNASELKGGAGVVMVPLWAGSIAFVRIFRHATRSWEWELPRGYLEPGIDESENAAREIQEELGVASDSIAKIGEVNPNTGLMTGLIGVYAVELAADPATAGKPQTDEGIAECQLVPRQEIGAFIAGNSVRCGISLASIFLYLNRSARP